LFKERWIRSGDINLKIPKPFHSSDPTNNVLEVGNGSSDLEYHDLLWIEASGIGANYSKALRKCLKSSSQTSPLLRLCWTSTRRQK
jgi:hypothetical protein